MLPQEQNKATMSSREIAELTGKDHRNVLRDCDTLNENYEKLSLLKIEQCEYKADNGQKYREYLLTRMQTFDLMTGYNTELRIKVNRRWEELETQAKQIDFNNPDTVLKLVQNWKDAEVKKERLQQQVQLQTGEIKKAAPKVEYYDEVMQSQSLIPITLIAKDLGMSGRKLNQVLHSMGIIYKTGGGTWVLYSPYQDKGYTKNKTMKYPGSHGEIKTSVQTYWTEKGREFIMNRVRKFWEQNRKSS